MSLSALASITNYANLLTRFANVRSLRLEELGGGTYVN